jgi:hypothetical protein
MFALGVQWVLKGLEAYQTSRDSCGAGFVEAHLDQSFVLAVGGTVSAALETANTNTRLVQESRKV